MSVTELAKRFEQSPSTVTYECRRGEQMAIKQNYSLSLIKSEKLKDVPHTAQRPLQNAACCPISASGSNFNPPEAGNPRNIQYIPAVKIISLLDLDQN
jgi:hypothetical protein